MNLWYEIKYTFRAIWKKLGFTALCIIVIALGYSITLPLYSFVKNLVYAELSFPDSEKLVFVRQTDALRNIDLDGASFDTFQFNAIQQSTEKFNAIGAFHATDTTLSDGAFAQQFNGSRITADALSFTSTTAFLGRTLTQQDALPGAAPVILIGYGVWQNYYAADPNIIGKTSRANGLPHTIIGVMPEGYKYPQVAEVWLPLTMSAVSRPGTQPVVSIVGMTAEGVSLRQATAELAAVVEGLSNEYPDVYANRSAKVTPYVQGFISNALTMFNSIGGLAVCIYLLICLNVGNLLIIRANERVGELAIRSAMGAGRLSIFGHVLIESFIVCFCGAVLGLLSAGWLLRVMQGSIFNMLGNGRDSSFWFDFSLNLDAVIVGIGMMLVLWFLSGSFAAWRVVKKDIGAVLGGDSKGIVGKSSGRITSSLVFVQVILSFFLLIMSGTYLFTLQEDYEQAVVADSEYYLTATIDLSNVGHSNANQRLLYSMSLRQTLAELNAIEALTFSSALPGSYSAVSRVTMDTDETRAEIEIPFRGVTWVDADYFQTLGFDLQQGRYFDSNDNSESEPVLIVDEAFIRKIGIVGSAVGKSVRLRDFENNIQLADSSELFRIVGVVPYVGKADESTRGRVYRAISQKTPDKLVLVTKLRAGNALSIADLETEIKLASRGINSDVSVHSFVSLATSADQQNFATNVFVSMFGGSAVGALILAVIGVYGLMARAVYSRTNEIGIRRAVGSSNSSIVKIFMRQGLFYLLSSVVIGGGLAVLAINITTGTNSSVLSSYNMASMLASVFIVTTSIVGALIFWASYVPVKKVITLEPGEALHYE